MAEKIPVHARKIGEKQGIPIYAANPSIPETESIAKRKRVQIGNDKRGMVFEDSGETLSVGGAAFYEFEEVDSARFVKLFLAGIKGATALNKAGIMVFEYVYRVMQEKPGTDRIELNFFDASQRIKDLSERTFRRGLRDLLEHEFLYRSPSSDVYFVNIKYMFNGDRLAFVKGYRLKQANTNQPDLFAALPTPDEEP